MQRYRRGHNGADSKSVCRQLHVGSNPTRCAIGAVVIFRRSPVFLPVGCLLALEHSAHCRGGPLLGGKVQVGIDVGGDGEGAVAQQDLDLFHRDTVT